MSAMLELWISGARDVFGYRFRDAWHVVGWEQGRVPDGYVCWLDRNQEQPPAAQASQLNLFEVRP